MTHRRSRPFSSQNSSSEGAPCEEKLAAAEVVLTVHRKATGQPVADADAGVIIYNKRNKTNKVGVGWGQTDDRGRVHTRVPVRRSYIRPGPVTLFAFAYIRQLDTYCASVMEYGYKELPRAFRATP